MYKHIKYYYTKKKLLLFIQNKVHKVVVICT